MSPDVEQHLLKLNAIAARDARRLGIAPPPHVRLCVAVLFGFHPWDADHVLQALADEISTRPRAARHAEKWTN